MNKFIINENASLIKNILIEDDLIFASDENYETEALFLEKITNPKKSILDTHLKIKFSEIIKFIPFENESAIQVFYKTDTKNSKTYFEFNSSEEYSKIKDVLIKKTNFTLKSELKSSVASWIKKAAYTFAATVISGIIYFMAKELENGNAVNISGGSRRGLKKIMLQLAESLGSTYTLIIAILVISSFCFWTYKAYTKGKVEIEFYS